MNVGQQEVTMSRPQFWDVWELMWDKQETTGFRERRWRPRAAYVAISSHFGKLDAFEIITTPKSELVQCLVDGAWDTVTCPQFFFDGITILPNRPVEINDYPTLRGDA